MITKAIINPGRQLEFDLAKVFSIFFMVVIHVYENMSSVDYSYLPNTAFRLIIEFLGGPLAAPVFMFAMGVGMVYTRHDSYQEFAKRGLKLLLLGYALNFFRNTVLVFLAQQFSVSTDHNQPLLDTFGLVDILQFAGMAFLAIALFKRLKLKGWHMAVVAFMMQGIGTVCLGLFDGIPTALQYLFGLVFHTNPYIAFPLSLWLVYPVLGICFAELLLKVADKNKFYRSVFSISLITLICTSIGMVTQGYDLRRFFALANETYYIQSVYSTLWIGCIVLMAISACYYLSRMVVGKGLALVKFISSNLNTIYMIQWIIIPYTIAITVVLGIGEVPELWIVPVGVVIAMLSILLAKVFGKRKFVY